MSSESAGYTTEFKHDTDNLVVFTIIVFSVCSVVFIIAVCLIFFRIGKDSEYYKKVVSQKSTALEALRAEEDELLSRSGLYRAESGPVYCVPIERAMDQIVKEYNK